MNKLFILIFLFPVFCLSQMPTTLEYTGRLDKDTIEKKTKIIDAVFLQDKISLMIGSNGCFHSVSVEYTFIKKTGYYEVVYAKRYNPKDKTPKCKGIVKLSNEKMEAIHKLCVHGLNIKQSFCTTSVDFELKGKAERVSFEDDRCSNDDDIMNQVGEIVGVCRDL